MRGYREKQQVMSESNRASERKESMNPVPGGDTRSEDGLRKRNICRNSKETARKVQRNQEREIGEMAQGIRGVCCSHRRI